jgi:O-antigen/teichoic acid export membrane protein
MSMVFRKDIIPASVRFGIPLIFTSVAFMILNVSDRYIIGYYRGSEEVALYDLGYRVAGVLNMFIIMPFTLTLLPSAYKMYGKEGDKRYYSKLLTYFTFILVWGGLALSLFAEELIQLFALNKDYWPSYKVVPLVIFGYIFSGMRLVAVLGQFLTRNLKSLIPLSLSAAFVNIVLNFVFIPIYGLIAAAYTTLLSFLFLYLLSLQISDRYYHIPFEHKKTFTLIALGVLFYLPFAFWSTELLILNLSVKLMSVLAFPVILLPFKFYEEAELTVIKKILHSPAGGIKELMKK